MKKLCGVYKITSPSGKVYIGSSKDIKRRFRTYKYLKGVKQQIKLYNSFLKYGIINHNFKILFLCSEKDRYYFERCFGDIYNSLKKGLNLSLPQREDLPAIISDETRLKFSIINKGINNKMYGKTHTKEAREKISKNAKIHLKKRQKIVYQYDLEGNLLNVFESVNEASRKTLIDSGSVCICCNKKIKQICGYVFRYENDNFSYERPYNKRPSKEEKIEIKNSLNNGVNILKLINTFNYSKKSILNCLN
jgi:group I intron endonuclease